MCIRDSFLYSKRIKISQDGDYLLTTWLLFRKSCTKYGQADVKEIVTNRYADKGGTDGYIRFRDGNCGYLYPSKD